MEHLSNFPNALFCILTIMAHNNQTTEPSQRGNKQICISKSSWEKSEILWYSFWYPLWNKSKRCCYTNEENDRHVYLKEKNIVGELSSTLSENGLVPLSVNWYNL